MLIEDTLRFLDAWGVQAARLGWTAIDLFGVHPNAPTARYDCMGLVPMLRSEEVVAIGATHATIKAGSGSLLTYMRRPMGGAVLVWDLA